MNHYEFENLLRHAPETSVKVSGQLHQDIMRSVRLAEAQERPSRFAWAGPALGAAMAVMVLAVLQISQPAAVTVKPQQPLVAHKVDSTIKLQAFGDSLKNLAGNSLLTENELKLELERLKSDLKRFDFRS